MSNYSNINPSFQLTTSSQLVDDLKDKDIAAGKEEKKELVSSILHRLFEHNSEWYLKNYPPLLLFIGRIKSHYIAHIADEQSIKSLVKVITSFSHRLRPSYYYDLIKASVLGGNAQLALQLLELEIDFSEDEKRFIIQLACQYKLYDVVRKLIEKGIDPTQNNVLRYVKLNSEQDIDFAKELIMKWGARLDSEAISLWMDNSGEKKTSEVIKLFLNEDQAQFLDKIFNKFPEEIDKSEIYRLFANWIQIDPCQKIDELMTIHQKGNSKRPSFMTLLCMVGYHLNVAQADTDLFFQRIQSKALLDGKLQRSILYY